MNNLVQTNAIEAALMQGNLSKLTSDQKLSYYQNLCESLGLNPLTKPFEYMNLKGKEVLYANKGCAEQLRSIHKISLKIIITQKIEDVYIVTTEAINKDGRTDSSTGAVSISGLKGEDLANALMKAETKAKRRVTFSICGLNMLDEMEVSTIADAKPLVEAEPIKLSAAAELGFQEEDSQGSDVGEYVVKFGKKLAGQKLKDIDQFELAGYLKYLTDGVKKTGKPLTGDALELYENGELYLKAREFVR